MEKFISFLRPLLYGSAVLGIMAIMMTQFTMDFRIILLAGSILFIVAGFITGKNKLAPGLISLLIIIPFVLVLNSFTYSQIPQAF